MTNNEIALVMRQALEALEDAQTYISEKYEDHILGYQMHPATESERLVIVDSAKLNEQAITSLRQAIATEESSATQELVTWRNAAIRVGENLCSVGPFGYYNMTAEQWLTWALSVVTVHSQSKAEQEPKRVPLTHGQRLVLLTSFEPYKNKWDSHSILIDMVEAAHGIKGEA